MTREKGIPKEYPWSLKNEDNPIHGNFFSDFFLCIVKRFIFDFRAIFIMQKKHFAMSTLVLLTLLMIQCSPIFVSATNTWGVKANDLFVWELKTVNTTLVLEAKVTAVAENLTLSTRIMDAKVGNVVQSAEWDSIAKNYFYSMEQIAILNSTAQAFENMTKTYAGKEVNVSKVTINSDNIIYIDRVSGVLCEAKINVGDTKYDLLIVSWANKTVEDFKQPSNPSDLLSQIDGYSVPTILLVSLIPIFVIFKAKQKKKA